MAVLGNKKDSDYILGNGQAGQAGQADYYQPVQIEQPYLDGQIAQQSAASYQPPAIASAPSSQPIQQPVDRQKPNWAQTLGATLQDVGAAASGRQGTALGSLHSRYRQMNKDKTGVQVNLEKAKECHSQLIKKVVYGSVDVEADHKAYDIAEEAAESSKADIEAATSLEELYHVWPAEHNIKPKDRKYKQHIPLKDRFNNGSN